MSTVLTTENLTMQFGGLKAVCDLSLSIPEKSIFGIIGPNGAGKTTVFNMLTGVYEPTQGSIRALGKRVNGMRPYEIARLGMSRTFQNIRLFKNLSVIDNVILGIDHDPSTPKSGLIPCLFRSKRSRMNEAKKIETAKSLLRLLQLEHDANECSGNLAYGEQRRLEIARALATGARIVLLDEPAAGMNSVETEELMRCIRHIRDEREVTVLLIEHDMKLVMGICERIAVLDYGKKIAEGTPEEIQKHPAVLEAYLGKAPALGEIHDD